MNEKVAMPMVRVLGLRQNHENENVLFFAILCAVLCCAVQCILLKNRINYDLRMSVLSVLLALHLIFIYIKRNVRRTKHKPHI